MAERYLVKDILGITLWEGMAATEGEAKQNAIMGTQVSVESVTAEIIPFKARDPVGLKARKPRADKSLSHAGRPDGLWQPDFRAKPEKKPAKKVRNAGYAIVEGAVYFYPDKPSLDNALLAIVNEAMRMPETTATGTTSGLDKVTILQGAKQIKVKYQPRFPLAEM